jgi:hypothetical protein
MLKRMILLFALLAFLLNACENKSAFYANNQVGSAKAAALVTQNLLSNLTTQIPIAWQSPADLTSIINYQFTVTDSDGTVVYQYQAPVTGITVGTQNQTKLPGPIPDGQYSLSLVAVSEYALNSAPVTTGLQIDATPPDVQIYLDSDPVADPCSSPPTAQSDSVNQTISFDFCAADPLKNGFASGLRSVCVVVNPATTQTPAADDACWKSPADITRSLTLKKGRNSVTSLATPDRSPVRSISEPPPPRR